VVKVVDALAGVRSLFLDTAPIIYLVERNPTYVAVARAVFRSIVRGDIIAVTSPVTLAETLVAPVRAGNPQLQRQYHRRIVQGENTRFAPIDELVAWRCADIRARYGLRLGDALQAAVAIKAGCDALLTNDPVFRRITEVQAIVMDDLEL
jgi:predicted nucleic acid-binding protein